MTLPAAIAGRIGRPELSRVGGQGGTAVRASGMGRVYGAGSTAAGLSSEAHVGSGSASFKVDTGTVSALMLAAIVVGVFAFYSWTRSAQA